MANNPNISTTLNKVSSAQLDTIANNGTVTKGDNTLTGSENAVYLTPDDSIVITDTAPTTATVGYIGQFRLIPTSGSEALYICTGTGSTYTWKQVTLS